MTDNNLVPYSKDYKLDEYLSIDTRLLKEPWSGMLDVKAVILHGYLLRLCSVSEKNEWIDKDGNIYVKLRTQEMANYLGVTQKTAIKFKKQLEDAGLINIPESFKENNSRHTAPIYVNVIRRKSSNIINMNGNNKNKFNNFQQNDYDMRKLEKELLDN